jgi:hypothetical protein
VPTKKIRKDEFHMVCMINVKVGGLTEITGFMLQFRLFIEVGMKKFDSLSSAYSISHKWSTHSCSNSYGMVQIKNASDG